MYEHVPFVGKRIYDQSRRIGRPKYDGAYRNDDYHDVRFNFGALYIEEPQWLILNSAGSNIESDLLLIEKVAPMEAIHRALDVYKTVVLPDLAQKAVKLTVKEEKSRREPIELDREWLAHLAAMGVSL